jgi:hypothetical protein
LRDKETAWQTTVCCAKPSARSALDVRPPDPVVIEQIADFLRRVEANLLGLATLLQATPGLRCRSHGCHRCHSPAGPAAAGKGATMSHLQPLRPSYSALLPEVPGLGLCLPPQNALSGPSAPLAKADLPPVSPLGQALATLLATLVSSLSMRLVLIPSVVALQSPTVSPP